MNKTDIRYQTYVEILQEELVPAMGCTEPIAIAYAASMARDTLGVMPESVCLEVSGSIIKNVKSVIVPNTGHRKGLEVAAGIGIVAGRTDAQLEVIAEVSEEELTQLEHFLMTVPVKVVHVENGYSFDLGVIVTSGQHAAKVRIVNHHTNVVHVEKDGEVLMSHALTPVSRDYKPDEKRTLLNMEDIWDFITTMDTEDVKEVLERQIQYNVAISQEGLSGNYGANIGRVLQSIHPDTVHYRAMARTAAGSDARMNGCELPVIINSGSGNQGITCSLPVITYAEELGSSHEELLRALALSNLVAIHQKTGIGTLSAYCGAVSAGAGAGAGISYLCEGTYEMVIHTVVNTLAIVSGIICDGAKASCAAKIASSVDAAILGFEMYRHGQQFRGGDGIVKKGVENTIRNIGILGREGMKETNDEIIRLMTE